LKCNRAPILALFGKPEGILVDYPPDRRFSRRFPACVDKQSFVTNTTAFLVNVDLLKQAPITTWNNYTPDEYGFYANVNPTVPHPRWNQSSERFLGSSSLRRAGKNCTVGSISLPFWPCCTISDSSRAT